MQNISNHWLMQSIDALKIYVLTPCYGCITLYKKRNIFGSKVFISVSL